MKIKPMIFQPNNVRAILDGHKTQTRRLTNRYNLEPGGQVWVRESWVQIDDDHDDIYGSRYCGANGSIYYKADYITPKGPSCRGLKFRSPIIMPKWACRLILEIEDVIEERLQDITEEGAIAEGIGYFRTNEMIENGKWPFFLKNGEIGKHGVQSAVHSYQTLWETIHGVISWEENPKIFNFKFKIHEVLT